MSVIPLSAVLLALLSALVAATVTATEATALDEGTVENSTDSAASAWLVSLQVCHVKQPSGWRPWRFERRVNVAGQGDALVRDLDLL
jgi:hypothetical protein